MSLADDLKQAWSSGDPQQVAALYTGDGVREEYFVTAARLQGQDEIAAQAGMYMRAVPDCSLAIRSAAEAGDGTTTVEWTWSGTHTGDVEGWPGRGERVELPGVSVCEMSGGSIRRERLYADFAILLAGAGLIPGVEAPAS